MSRFSEDKHSAHGSLREKIPKKDVFARPQRKPVLLHTVRRHNEICTQNVLGDFEVRWVAQRLRDVTFATKSKPVPTGPWFV